MDLRRLARPGATLESLELSQPTSAAAVVKARVEPAKLKALPQEAQSLLAEAPQAVEAALSGAPLGFKAKLALEALVRVDGRPALPFRDGEVDLARAEAEGWAGELQGYEKALGEVAAAVGRIDLAGVHVGTGFLVAPNLVLTNRHVAEVIAKAYRRPLGEVWLMKAGRPWIDFARELDATATRRFAILRVVAAGPDPIGMEVNPRRLDAALLEIAETSLEGEPQSRPLALLDPSSLANDDAGRIFSIGYPGAPAFEPKGPVPTTEEQAIMAALKRIFAMTYGVKRLSPGEILSRAGRVPDGGRGWVFTHDATTLGGASGSCIVRLAGGAARVMGLHFGGAWLKHNYAHLTAKLKEPILDRPTISWRL